ncbi:hypothetical protein Droror1_Dr00003433 [Drosera rotundifolia]
MYVTRPLSLYKRSPELLELPPPSGPNSGYLVVEDEESVPTCCFGTCTNPTVEGLPMPQNKRIDVQHGSGDNHTSYGVFFVPVVGTALSENRYYAVKADGRRGKGEVYTSRKEETMVNCFCCFCGSDEKPQPLDPTNTYQQVVLSYTPGCGNHYFSAKSVTEDGVLPSFLRTNPWAVSTHTPNFTLHEANGINASLRDRLPSISADAPVVVGKWYCPFLFIKEGKPKEQMKKSMFYEVTLEQRWKMIFSHEYEFKGTNSVSFDVVVPTHVPKIAGIVAVQDTNATDDGIVWLKCTATTIDEAEEARVGLSGLVMERMIWEQERLGWVNNKEKQIRVARAEEYGGVVPWMKFGCYVLVESFVFRRTDGSIALAYDFMHSHRIRVEWA